MLEAGLLSDFSDSLILSTIHLHYTKLVIYKVRCLARRGGDWTVTRRVPIVCILIETTRGVSHGAVVVTVQHDEACTDCWYTYRNNTRCLTRRGGGDGSAVARRGDDEAPVARRGADEARADCLHTYSNNAWWRWRDMRGDSRGAVLTTRTHTLSRSLTIFCPRFERRKVSSSRSNQKVSLNKRRQQTRLARRSSVVAAREPATSQRFSYQKEVSNTESRKESFKLKETSHTPSLVELQKRLLVLQFHLWDFNSKRSRGSVYKLTSVWKKLPVREGRNSKVPQILLRLQEEKHSIKS
ncbi:hypothetical protein J6590_023874 [Homalodisca vitripennis]|nr:hypothetical protein J6590_023874 [Homalodisca vitripennis]